MTAIDVGNPICLMCCAIDSDDANRYDSDDPGPKWLERSGDVDIDQQTFLFAGSGLNLMTLQTLHPGGPLAPFHVRVKFKRSSPSQIAEIIFRFADIPNYGIARVRRVDGCDRIELDSGTNTGNPPGEPLAMQIIGDGLTEGEFHQIDLCVGCDEFGAIYDGVVNDLVRIKVTPFSGKPYLIDALPGAVPISCTTVAASYSPNRYVGLSGSQGLRMDDFYFGWMRADDFPCKGICTECRGPCRIEDDDFDRYDSDLLGCKWVKLTGTSRINAANLEFTSPTGRVRCAVRHPNRRPDHWVSVEVLLAAGTTHKVRVAASEDGGNYLYGAVSAADGNQVRIHVGGSLDGQFAEDFAYNVAGWHRLIVCTDGHRITAALYTLAGVQVAAVAGLGNSYVGPREWVHLEADSVYTGTRFDNFVFEKRRTLDDPECQACPRDLEFPKVGCYGCYAGLAHKLYLISYGSWGQNNPCGGPTCEEAFGDGLIVQGGFQNFDCLVFGLCQCVWGAFFRICPHPDINDHPFTVEVTVTLCISTDEIRVEFKFVYATLGGPLGAYGYATYLLPLYQPLDCLEIDGLEIPFASEIGCAGVPGNTPFCSPRPKSVFLMGV